MQDPAHRIIVSGSEGLDQGEEAFTGFMVESCGVLSEGYVHNGPDVCLGNGQKETECVPSHVVRGDALCGIIRAPAYYTTHDMIPTSRP